MLTGFRSKIILFLCFGFTIVHLRCTKLPEPPQGLTNKIILEISDAQSITSSAVTISGTISCSVDNLVGKERGYCMSNINSTPTINDTKYAIGSGIGSYSGRISNLLPSRQYYYRPYIILGSTSDVLYGSIKKFTTLAAPVTISTSNVTNLTTTAATCGGTISTDGGSTITQRGVCWSTSSAPTTLNTRTINGSGLGSYTSNVTGLTPSTTYYIRAYAVNSTGTTYGQELSFTTGALPPTVTSGAISSVTTSSALYSGGNVTSTAPITDKGVCWSTNTNPTIANTRVSSGSGVGSIVASITGLSAGTKYYVKAYAISSAGISYGSELTFTTTCTPQVPTLLSPVNGTIRGCCYLNFSWNQACGATAYQIQVSKSPTFAFGVTTINTCGGSSNPNPTATNQATTSTTTFCMNGGSSSNDGIWYWRVRSTDGTNFSAWSSVNSYTYKW